MPSWVTLEPMWMASGEQGDSLVGGEQLLCRGPALDDTNDDSSRTTGTMRPGA